jgi:hypothetical protein
MTRSCALVLAVVLLSTSGGCAAVPLAAAGTLAGIASSTVGAGSDLYRAGKLDAADLAAFDAVAAAAEMAGEDMGFALKGRAPVPAGRLRLSYVDDRGATITVTADRRTATLTHTRIDVGLFGSETTARLMLGRIRAHLPDNDRTRPARRSTKVEAAEDTLD